MFGQPSARTFSWHSIRNISTWSHKISQNLVGPLSRPSSSGFLISFGTRRPEKPCCPNWLSICLLPCFTLTWQDSCPSWWFGASLVCMRIGSSARRTPGAQVSITHTGNLASTIPARSAYSERTVRNNLEKCEGETQRNNHVKVFGSYWMHSTSVSYINGPPRGLNTRSPISTPWT